MAQHSQLPKFGNWESDENVPYTAYFDNARKRKGGGRTNPNDREVLVQAPSLQQEARLKGQMGTAAIRSKHEHRMSHSDGELQEATDSSLQHDTLVQRPVVDSYRRHYGGVRSVSSKGDLEAPKSSNVLRPRHERQLSLEEDDLRRPRNSPLQHETVGQGATVDSPHARRGSTSAGETPRRVARQSAGSRSIDHSPLHPQYQAKVGGKVGGVSSPLWEKKGPSEGSQGLASSTPGRSQLRSVTRGDDIPDYCLAVPKFGDWDESDPASAEGFSGIFDKVREEKQTGVGGKIPVVAGETSYSNGHKQYGRANSKSCCCFPWGRK